MNLSLKVPTPLEYFSSLVHNDADFPLLEAAISLGQDEYPDMNVQSVLSEVDQLMGRLHRRLPADAGPLHKLRILNQFVYRDLGFAGNFNHFSDPDNSYIHVVLSKRLAIPISMAVIWLELAQGLDLKCSSKIIAIEYASSPVDEAALQILTEFLPSVIFLLRMDGKILFSRDSK